MGWHVVCVLRTLPVRDASGMDLWNCHGARMLNGVKFAGVVLIRMLTDVMSVNQRNAGRDYTQKKSNQGLLRNLPGEPAAWPRLQGRVLLPTARNVPAAPCGVW